MNCAIVIPALNPSHQLLEFVAELRKKGASHIVIVNDGSEQAYLPVFEQLATFQECTVLIHQKNCGKGCALKTAFSYFKKHLFYLDGVVTADADGQHRADDVLRVAKTLKPDAKAIVLGVRTFQRGHTPFRSLFGNKATSRIFQMLYGIYLKDTQTGLRGIPSCAIEWALSARGERYEYELDFLIKARRKAYAFIEIPIKTLYFDNNAESHYNTFKDGSRVFLMMLSGLAKYFYSSIASAATDVISFFLLNQYIFANLSIQLRLFLATLLARILSSALNFSLNCSVFSQTPGNKMSRAVRYYILWMCQLLSSYGLVYLFSFFIFSDTVSKIMVDLFLAVVSYQIQLHWVFRTEKS